MVCHLTTQGDCTTEHWRKASEIAVFPGTAPGFETCGLDMGKLLDQFTRQLCGPFVGTQSFAHQATVSVGENCLLDRFL